ncbi:MAG: hypothetical protein ACW99A_21750, partial [Candidatus Kariarchaeaceae archaeon]
MINKPLSSAPNITISTPANQTYNAPMSGYYPATYGFENDLIGNTIKNWNVEEYPSCTIEVFSENQGHYKVLRIYDDTDLNYALTYNDFSSITSGSIEFWFYGILGGADSGVYMTLNEGGYTGSASVSLYFDITNEKLQYNDSSSLTDICGLANNAWQHIKFTFDTSTDDFDIWVNNTLRGTNLDFDNNIVSADNFLINSGNETTGGSGGFNAFFDAIGYSWDPAYTLGSNIYEGLLLSYDNTTNLEWMGYSLDGQSNKTIIGNSSIPIPSKGSHNIQVFGNNSVGTMFDSDLMYFTVDYAPIDMITPINNTYYTPMGGYYPGTYGFENSPNTNNPTDWTISEPASTDVQVIQSLGGHSKVVEIWDNSNSGGVNLVNSFSGQTSGTIEFYMRREGSWTLGTGTIWLLIREGGTRKSGIALWNNAVDAYGSTNLISEGNWQDDEWYHFKFEFDCGTDENKISIDGEDFGTHSFSSTATSIDSIEIYTLNSETQGNTYFYLDAFGYSWDSEYSTGDNLLEGLLLSYDNDTDLDWTGYSLDGNSNINLNGNTTLRLPTNGLHTLQFFGNNSFGTIFATDLRYFTIDYQPFINSTPENITYYSAMSGYFPATYGFESNAVNRVPSDFRTTGNASITYLIKTDIFNHKHVIEINDSDNTNSGAIYNDFSQPQINGTIEFWWLSSDSTKNSTVDILSGTNYGVTIGLFGGDFRYYDGLSWNTVASGAQSNRWYHHKLFFNCTSDTFDWYINDTLEGNQLDFRVSQAQLTRIQFNSGGISTDYEIYIDALGYSWDLDYTIGSNL